MKTAVVLLLVMIAIISPASAECVRWGRDVHGNRVCIVDANQVCVNRCIARGEPRSTCVPRCLDRWR